MADLSKAHAVVRNIPGDYHSSDLRNFFSQFLESGGFDCFHFRHRPEIQVFSTNEKSSHKDVSIQNTLSSTSFEDRHGNSKTCESGSDNLTQKTTLCCVVRLLETKLEQLIRMYHRKHWLDRNGDSMRPLCIIHPVRVHGHGTNTGNPVEDTQYKTRGEARQIPPERETFSQKDLDSLKELHPPALMPQGNVGTPTKFFMDMIQACKLPPRIIKKLGLTFPKTRTNKKYGNVPFDYQTDVENGGMEEVVVTASGHEIESDIVSNLNQSASKRKSDSVLEVDESSKKAESKKMKELMAENIEEKMIPQEDSDKEHDNDSCEEWERHEALTDDAANVERNKERLFENEMEIVWEKGGSGLVFYTDAQFWDAKEGDFDAKTADDWDVDMSVYYEEGAGDMDAKDHVAMRREQRLRKGIDHESVFTKNIGKFEKHTKGIGRRLLERQGWQDGAGLGSSVEGISEALENDGQGPRDRTGFGYHGEKLQRFGVSHNRPGAQRQVIISTVYDNPKDTDPQEPLLRRHEPYHLKYRDPVKFTKSTSSTVTNPNT